MKRFAFFVAAALLASSALFSDAEAKRTITRRRLVKTESNTLLAEKGMDMDADAQTIDPTEEAEKLKNEFNSRWGSFPRWLQITLAIGGAAIGLAELFAGYRYWKFSVVLIGAYAAGLAIYTLLVGQISDSDDNKMYYVYAGAGGAALLGGLFFGKFTNFATFLMGASVGIIAAIVLEPILWSKIWESHQDVMTYIAMAVLGLVGGLLVYAFEKTMVILATAMVGAFLAIGGIGLLADSGGWPVDFNASTCDSRCWGYLGGFAGAVLLGMFVQVAITAKGYDHKKESARRNKEDDEYDYMAQQGQAAVQGGGIKYA